MTFICGETCGVFVFLFKFITFSYLEMSPVCLGFFFLSPRELYCHFSDNLYSFK